MGGCVLSKEKETKTKISIPIEEDKFEKNPESDVSKSSLGKALSGSPSTKNFTSVEFHGVPGRKIHLQDLKISVPDEPSKPVSDPSSYWDYWKKKFGTITKLINCQSNYNSQSRFDETPEIPFGVTASLLLAYNNHADVVLRPDDVWFTICSGLAIHIEENAEKLRNLFVDHKGKKNIELIIDESFEEVEWEKIPMMFSQALEKAVKGDIVNTIQCNFSTSTEIDKIASMICLMSTMKKYFRYIVFGGCGIRNVIMLGTEEDWIKLKEKALSLKKYELDTWIPKVIFILDNFIETFRGNPDLKFWNYMVDKTDGVGGSGVRTIDSDFTGWIINFYPYNSDRRSFTTLKAKDFPSSIVQCPLTFIDLLTRKKTDMQVATGFSGQGYENEAFFPQLSYAFFSLIQLVGKIISTTKIISINNQFTFRVLKQYYYVNY